MLLSRFSMCGLNVHSASTSSLSATLRINNSALIIKTHAKAHRVLEWVTDWLSFQVVDAGFPKRGSAKHKVGVPTYYIGKLFPETAWTRKNGSTLAPSLDRPVLSYGILSFAKTDKYREDCKWYRVNACCTQIWRDERHISVFHNEFSDKNIYN